MRRSYIVCPLLALCLTVTAAAQTTYEWSGGVDYDPLTPGNWVGGVAPTGLPTDTLLFDINYPPFYIDVTSPLVTGNLVFSQPQSGINIQVFSGGSLTLNGNITTNATPSSYFGYNLGSIILTSGVHTFNIGNNSSGFSSLNMLANISGEGASIVVEGGQFQQYLYLLNANTYTGGTVIQGGSIVVNNNAAFGTGTVTLNGGSLAPDLGSVVELGNDFQLGASATFYSGSSDAGLLTNRLQLDGNIAPMSGVTTVAMTNNGSPPLVLAGAISDGAAATTYHFNGKFSLEGRNTYTGGTVVDYNGSVVFRTIDAIPAAGLITAAAGGYVGLGDTTAVAAFMGRLDQANFAGAVGFDTVAGSDPQTFSGSIDLSGFTQPGVAIGTSSSAILYGNIVEPSGAPNYNFFGQGWLFLSDEAAQPSYPLTGNHGLSVNSQSNPLLLVLSRSAANTYNGTTAVQAGGIVFDSPGALPAGSAFTLNSYAYIGYTEATGLTPAQFVSHLAGDYTAGILGFDSHDYINNQAYPSAGNPLHIANPTTATITNLDLSNATVPVYVGTVSRAIIAGSFTATSGGTGDYYFTGFQGGALQVSSQLTGANRVAYLGLPLFLDTTDTSSVQLNNPANNYGGGTVLQSGQLIVNGSGVLGTGLLTAGANINNQSLTLGTGSNPVVLANNIDLQYNVLNLQPVGSLTLSGNITGPGYLSVNGSGSLLLLGNSDFSGGTTIVSGSVMAGSNNALGTSSVYINGGSLSVGSTVVLSNPIIFGSSGGVLGGTGTIANTVTIGNLTSLAPGSSPGALTFTNGLVLAPGGGLNFQVQLASGVAGTDYDTLNITGGALGVTASSGSPFSLRLISLNSLGTPGSVTDFNTANSYSWLVATGNTSGGITNFSADKFILDTTGFSNSLNGGSFSLAQGLSTGNPALFLNFTPVPEPSTYALMLGGLGLMTWTWRRRRRA